MNAQPLAPPAVPRAVTSRPARRRAGALGLAAVLATGLAVTSAQSATADEPAVGSSTLVPIQVTGDPSERFSLVILGDGYTADEQPLFREQVEKHLETMWSIEPYKSYRNYFNVYAVEIISGESGISCDSSLDSPRRNTPLKMSFWGGCNPNSVQRLITMDSAKAREYAKIAPKVDQVLALANSDTYGGAGGSYATASGGNSLSALISPHEIGHSLGGLADEYDYYTRGVTTGDYTGGEPRSKHHTIMTVEEMAEQQAKWWRWLGEPSEAGGVIGAYEGGQYYSTGIFRPSRHSMMKTLGYQMDQVSREIMTERVSSKIPLIAAAPDEATPLAADEVISIDVAHPVYHELDVDWTINGEAVPNPHNTTQLELAKTKAKPGDTVTVKVVDNTPFVRDPALRDSASMTQTRTWTVGTGRAAATDVEPAFTESTQTERPVGSLDVLYVETTHRPDRVFDVIWTVDGERQPNPHNARTLELADLELAPGTHTVTASVGDSKRAAAAAETLTWTVDAEGPTVESVVSAPVETSVGANGEPHYVVDESFTMKLTASDDQAGALVTEFRLDGDGWHNYYGWPTDADAPFLFTPTGTNVDDLIYGNLGTGGMSLSPFQPREPGYGEHRVEYRSTDAAGNIGPVEAFTVEVRP